MDSVGFTDSGMPSARTSSGRRRSDSVPERRRLVGHSASADRRLSPVHPGPDAESQPRCAHQVGAPTSVDDDVGVGRFCSRSHDALCCSAAGAAAISSPQVSK